MGRLFLGSGGIILRRLWGDRLWEYSDNMFCSKPVMPNISASPVKQKTLGHRPSCFLWSCFHGMKRLFTKYIVRIFGRGYRESQLPMGLGEVGDECLGDKCLLVWMRERIEWDVFV